MRIKEELLYPNKLEIARSKEIYALIFINQSKLNEAKKQQKESLKLFESIYSNHNNFDIARALSNLSLNLFQLNKFE